MFERLWMILRLAALLLLLPLPSAAHFAEGTQVRTVMVETSPDGLVAYVRLPAPLLFADAIDAARGAGIPFEHPFLRTGSPDGGPALLVDRGALLAAPAMLADRLVAAHEWRQNGQPVGARLLDWRVAEDDAAPFGDAAEARAALQAASASGDPDFGEAAFVYALALEAPMPEATVEVRSGFPPLDLAPGVALDTHLVDLRGEAVLRTAPGHLQDWEAIDGSGLAAFTGFVWQGVLHILIGLDHVLLVVCMVLGLGFTTKLLWTVTAFTLGHSASLVAAFLGLAPSWPWFIPAVEAAIAATVVYAAVAAWQRRLEAPWIMGAVGLLHGFGFAFVLSDILGRDTADLVPALAAFTLGIEVGQVLVIALVLLPTWALAVLSQRAALVTRGAVLAVVALVSLYWTAERVVALA